MQGEFQYSTQPHAAPIRKLSGSKYRTSNENEPQSEIHTGNVMYDPRIVRGNTYSAKILSNDATSPGKAIKLQSPARKKKLNDLRSRTPPPVHGRVHMDLQTDTYLEELVDRPIEKNAETQTHLFYDRPPSPLFVPTKTGRDVSTQILSGDLFVFDMEVEPILEVLIGKTLQSAMLELMQEEEIEAIRHQQYEFETIRDAELTEVKRLEAESLRKHLEKERRVAQAKQRQLDRQLLNEKITAKSFAIQLLSDLQLDVFDTLEKEGYFYDPVEKEIDELYLPNLFTNLKQRVKLYNIAEQMTQELIQAAYLKAKTIEMEEMKRRDEEDKRLAAILEKAAKEEEEKLKQLEEEKKKLLEADALKEQEEGEEKAEEEEQ
jgi:hypothetical protein